METSQCYLGYAVILRTDDTQTRRIWASLYLASLAPVSSTSCLYHFPYHPPSRVNFETPVAGLHHLSTFPPLNICYWICSFDLISLSFDHLLCMRFLLLLLNLYKNHRGARFIKNKTFRGSVFLNTTFVSLYYL